MDDRELAAAFTELFAEVYLRFHRRRHRRDGQLTSQQWAVLQHLSWSGPLTVGECARHLERAQSVVSEIIDGLEGKALLERVRDERDRRRVLVWLSDEGQAAIARERQVLDLERLARAAAGLTQKEKQSLLGGLRALVRAADRRDGAKEDGT